MGDSSRGLPFEKRLVHGHIFSRRTGARIQESPGFHCDTFITNFSAVFNLKIIDFEIELIDKHGADFTGPRSTIGMDHFKELGQATDGNKKVRSSP